MAWRSESQRKRSYVSPSGGKQDRFVKWATGDFPVRGGFRKEGGHKVCIDEHKVIQKGLGCFQQPCLKYSKENRPRGDFIDNGGSEDIRGT